MKRVTYILTAFFLVFVSCKDKIAESQIAAQVGNSVLLATDVRVLVPLGVTGADSLAFVNDYIDNWIEEHILFEQGLRNLPDIDRIDQQVAEYRRALISQNYENELIRSRLSEDISEEESLAFYNKYGKQLRLEQPIVQGVFVKILRNSSKVNDVKKWLKQLNEGKTECIEEFDQYGMYRAAAYDNFFDTWVSLYRLSDKLPETIVDAASFLKCKTYEMSDSEYYYLFVVKDYRLAGEPAPYEYAKADIYEILVGQRRKAIRQELIDELKKDGLQSGFVKVNK